jgi:multidrug efflux pump subunit AcrA (membrane-fusion protein)
MLTTTRARFWIPAGVIGLGLAIGAVLLSARDPQSATPSSSERRQTTSTVTRRDFVRSIRIAGTVEAVQATTVSVPRLQGQGTTTMSLVITRLIRAGSLVRPGDLLVEFDRQDQLKNALDRRAELSDLEQQIKKKEAEERAARARDDTALQAAETGLTRAQLDVTKNELIPKIQAEKNTLALEEAQAKLAQLKKTYDLKRSAAEADIRILQIRRDRAENAMKQAETNANKMSVASPIEGMAVLRTIWKSNTMAEVQEGEEVRAGMPIVDVVNPSIMRIRAKLNQADVNELRPGQPVSIGLDAYPDLSFKGRITQISPLAVRSTMSPKVRTFVALVEVLGSHPKLMPDLTASLDVELAREPNAVIVPRDSIRYDGGQAVVRVSKGSSFEERPVTIGSLNAHEAVVTSGIQEGVTIARNVNVKTGR